MMEILKKAREKKIFQRSEFEELLMKIQLADGNLRLDSLYIIVGGWQ